MGWDQTHEDGREGYAVKYGDGYISWSPKDVFEAAYLPIGHVGHLSEHVQRLIGEKAQNDQRVEKIDAVLTSAKAVDFSADAIGLLEDQARVMRELSSIFADRLALMNPDQ